MFRSPFDDLGKKRLENPQGEEVEGSFACQERGCFSYSGDARYLSEVQVLTWECPVGHINKIEGFRLDG